MFLKFTKIGISNRIDKDFLINYQKPVNYYPAIALN